MVKFCIGGAFLTLFKDSPTFWPSNLYRGQSSRDVFLAYLQPHINVSIKMLLPCEKITSKTKIIKWNGCLIFWGYFPQGRSIFIGTLICGWRLAQKASLEDWPLWRPHSLIQHESVKYVQNNPPWWSFGLNSPKGARYIEQPPFWIIIEAGL